MKRTLSHMQLLSIPQQAGSVLTVHHHAPGATSRYLAQYLSYSPIHKRILKCGQPTRYSNAGDGGQTLTSQRGLLCPSVALKCGSSSDSQNLGTFWVTHYLLGTAKDSPCTGEKLTCHTNLLRKTLTCRPTNLPKKKILNKEYTLSSSERGKGHHASTSPRTQHLHRPSSPAWMDLSTLAWTPTTIYTTALHSMAGVCHHKELTLKSPWDSRTWIPQLCGYRGIPTTKSFSRIHSMSLRAVHTASPSHQCSTVHTNRLTLV